MKLHVGCGARFEPNWINIDAENLKVPNGYAFMRLDVTRGLPFKEGSVTLVYSEHFIEHITRSDAVRFFKECHRVLGEGGVLRVSTPDLRRLVSRYLEADLSAYAKVNYYPLTACQMLNEGVRMWGHLFVYDYEELVLVLKEAGFTFTRPLMHGASSHSVDMITEGRPDCGELIMEAVKQ